MMKKLYLLLAFITLCMPGYSQRYADLELVQTIVSTGLGATPNIVLAPYHKRIIDGKTRHFVTWMYINHGPDTIQGSDHVYVKSNHTYGHHSTNGFFPPNGPTGGGLLPDSQGFIPPIPPGAIIPSFDTVDWCDSIWIAGGSGPTLLIDPDMTNNYHCTPVELQFAWAVGINTISHEEDGFLLYPNPANDKLNVRFDFDNARNVRILLRNTVGQLVYDHSFGNYSGTLVHTVDVEGLPPGVYTAELHYDGQAIVSKMIKQ